jgi:hypothetical protein
MSWSVDPMHTQVEFSAMPRSLSPEHRHSDQLLDARHRTPAAGLEPDQRLDPPAECVARPAVPVSSSLVASSTTSTGLSSPSSSSLRCAGCAGPAGLTVIAQHENAVQAVVREHDSGEEYTPSSR